MNIDYDNGKIMHPKLYLARPGEKLECIINGIQEDTCQFVQNLKQFDTLSFTINRYIWDEENSILLERICVKLTHPINICVQ